MAAIILFDSDTAENEGQYKASDTFLLQQCFISCFTGEFTSCEVAKSGPLHPSKLTSYS